MLKIFITFNNLLMTKTFNRPDSIAHFGFNLIKADVDMALKYSLRFYLMGKDKRKRSERQIEEYENTEVGENDVSDEKKATHRQNKVKQSMLKRRNTEIETERERKKKLGYKQFWL